jgi:hypothetical protein
MYRIEITCSYPDLGAIEMQLYTYGPYRRYVWQESVIVHYQQADILRAHVRRLERAQMLTNVDAAYGAIFSAVQECEALERQQVRRTGRTVFDAITDGILGRRPSDEA